jgi:hypothetical protein
MKPEGQMVDHLTAWETGADDLPAGYPKRQRRGYLHLGETVGTTKLQLESSDWTEGEIPKREWLAPRYLCRGTVTVLAGAGAAGKSLVAIAWAVALVLGRDLGDFRPTGEHRVMVLSYEDDDTEQKRRLSAALRGHGKTSSDLVGKLGRLICPDDMGALFTDPLYVGSLDNTDWFNQLDDHLAEFRPDLLIVDVLAEIHDLNESDNASIKQVMRRLTGLARKYNLAILCIHHFRKGATEPGDVDAIRGATAIVNTARQAFTLATMTKEEAVNWNISESSRKAFARLDDAKLNYSAGGATAWFERTYYPLDNGESVPASLPWTPPSGIASLMQVDDLVEAIGAGIDGGPYTRPLRANAPRSILKLFQRLGLGNGKDNADLITRLIAEGRIEEAEWRNPADRHYYLSLRVVEGQFPMADWRDQRGAK